MAKGRKTGGRTAGTPNKLQADLKEMILGALDDAGGRSYLVEQARTSPSAFLTLVGKILPTQLEGGNTINNTLTLHYEAAAAISTELNKRRTLPTIEHASVDTDKRIDMLNAPLPDE